KIDSVVTNKYLSLPIFALIMFGVYYLSVSTLGGALADLIESHIFGENGIPFIAENFLNNVNCAPWLTSLIVDGIIGGVGAVLTFVPQIIVLFIFLSFLEDCGYMSRIAFIMDKLFRKFGLSGKSFIPILVGTGCGVPGIMSSRTIENVNERRMTIITTTFIPCGAKLPVIALIASALFGKAWWVAPSAYFIGIASIICSGILLKKTKIFSGDVSPFVMELPSYHMPTAKSVARATWDRTWSYIKKAGTIILLASCGVWFLSTFGFYGGKFGMVQHMDNSVLAYIGNFIRNIFTPLGFGTWQASVATLLGLAAKEEIVGVFGVLYDNIGEGFTALSGYSFLIFNLLCAPCVAAMSAIRREMNSVKWTAFAISYQCVFAYCVSLVVYQLALVITSGGIAAGTIVALIVLAIFLFMLFRKPYKAKK
ncbi:MAG: ferrous iron transport protein B, partial [Eubacterium sp.]|nr:ferrous iron transport protein B [Eubacterium sp.]